MTHFLSFRGAIAMMNLFNDTVKILSDTKNVRNNMVDICLWQLENIPYDIEEYSLFSCNIFH